MKADTILYNGLIYSFDEKETTYQAVAIKDGYIEALGTSREMLAYDAPEKVDLDGKMVIPGIVDCHLHPYWGGKLLAGFSLEYAPLTPEETVARIAARLAKDPQKDENDWFHVRGWVRIGGSDVTRHDLDAVTTKRPIILFSNDCHFIALNSRGLALMGITKDTPEPPDGNILRDANGDPTGIIEDAPAMRIYDKVSSLRVEEAAEIVDKAQKALNAQGVTTVMDARVEPEGYGAYRYLRDNDRLTLRILGAREITPFDCQRQADADNAVKRALDHANQYTPAAWSPKPGLGINHIKLFVDGILHTRTAFMLEPYYEDRGTENRPDWQPGTQAWHPYFKQEIADAIISSAAKFGMHPHIHVIGDGAVDLACNAIEKMRATYPGKDIRPALAHNEVVADAQFKRVAGLGAYVCLSFQWCGMDDETHEISKNILGEKRYQENLEPHAKFIDAGAKVAYGSDWPIDPLNEWHNFQLGCTRKLPGGKRLDSDRNLTMREVLKAATITSAQLLGKEQYIGSLEKGKFADMAVLDRDVLKEHPEKIMKTRVLRTIIGGRTVYEAG